MITKHLIRYKSLIFFGLLISSCDPLVNEFNDIEEAIMYRANNITEFSAKDTIKVMTWNIRFGVARLRFFGDGCGDRVILQFRLDGQGSIVEAGAQSEGCSIIQASASMLADIALGKSVAELEGLSQLFRTMMRGGPSTVEAKDELGDLHSLQVVRQFPVRIKCALLPWTALEIGIEGFRSKNS